MGHSLAFKRLAIALALLELNGAFRARLPEILGSKAPEAEYFGCFIENSILSSERMRMEEPTWCFSASECQCPSDYPYIGFTNGNLAKSKAEWTCFRSLPPTSSSSCLSVEGWHVGKWGWKVSIYDNPQADTDKADFHVDYISRPFGKTHNRDISQGDLLMYPYRYADSYHETQAFGFVECPELRVAGDMEEFLSNMGLGSALSPHTHTGASNAGTFLARYTSSEEGAQQSGFKDARGLKTESISWGNSDGRVHAVDIGRTKKPRTYPSEQIWRVSITTPTKSGKILMDPSVAEKLAKIGESAFYRYVRDVLPAELNAEVVTSGGHENEAFTRWQKRVYSDGKKWQRFSGEGSSAARKDQEEWDEVFKGFHDTLEYKVLRQQIGKMNNMYINSLTKGNQNKRQRWRTFIWIEVSWAPHFITPHETNSTNVFFSFVSWPLGGQ